MNKSDNYNSILLCCMSVVIACVFLACSQNASNHSYPQKPANVSLQENPLQHRSVNEIALWEPPSLIAQDSVPLAEEGTILGPNLQIDNLGNRFVLWRNQSNLDPQTGNYLNINSQFFQQELVNNTWVASTAIAANEINDTLMPVIVSHALSPLTYAFWLSNGEIIFSTLDSSNTWAATQTLGVGQNLAVSINENGDAFIVLVNENADTTIELRVLKNTPGIGLTAPVSLTRGTANATTPFAIENIAVDQKGQNQALFVWLENNNGTREIWSSEFSEATGISQSQAIVAPALQLNSDVLDFVIVQNLVNPTAELLVNVENNGNSNIHTLNYANMLWSDANRLDDVNAAVSSDLDIAISANMNGDILVAWRELEQVNAELFNRIVSRHYSTANAWAGKITVSDNTAQAQVLKPTASLNNSGSGAIAWVEENATTSNLNVSHINAGIWLPVENIVSHDIATDYVVSANIKVDDTGVLSISWHQRVATQTTMDHFFWSSVDATTLITEPLLPGVWTEPLDIWQDQITTNYPSQVHGPNISLSSSGETLLSIHQNTNYDAISGGFINRQSTLLLGTNASAWSETNPQVTGSTLQMSNYIVKRISNNNDAYTVWTDDGSLYINFYVQGTGWQTPALIWQKGAADVDLRRLDLMVDANDDAWVWWVNQDEVNLTRYAAVGANAGVLSTSTLTVGNVLIYAPPVISDTGLISVAWVTDPSNVLEPNTLQLVRFNTAGTWRDRQSAPLLNSFNPMSSHLSLITISGETVMAMSQDAFGKIFSIVHQPVSGWDVWYSVDYNINNDDLPAHSAKITANANGEIFAIWSEETISEIGQDVIRIYTNQYNANAPAGEPKWPLPTRVGTVSSQINPTIRDQVDYKTFPLISVMDDGRAFAVWLDINDVSSALYSKEYDPLTGWAGESALIVSYERASEGVVKSADLEIDNTGIAYVSWQQEFTGEFANDYRVYLSRYRLP